MKNQYFGDINDYLKYGMLRTVSRASGLRLAVCWMLTPDDGRPDGKKIGYLNAPATWRQYDPTLFDILKTAVTTGRRNIDVAGNQNILPGAVYHSESLCDDRESRQQYLDRLAVMARGCDLVFFDPDNGMEVRSKPKGRKSSSKYLYWEDVRRFSTPGRSLIVFQHFARVKHDVYVAGMRDRFRAVCDAEWVGVVRTPNVAYFLVLAPEQVHALRAACDAARTQWRPHLRCD
jgi:hypothetical protein